MKWIPITPDRLPPEGVEIMTKIHDGQGCRNEQSLVYKSSLWWFPDMSMYVYYCPTHWARMEEAS